MKRVFAPILCLVLIAAIFSADAYAIEPNNFGVTKPTQLEKLLHRLGRGSDALVAVRLRDKPVLSGWVSETSRDSFVLVDTKDSGQRYRIYYGEVSRLAGYNLVTGVNVQHGGGVRAKLAQGLAHLIPGKRVPVNSLTGGERTLLIGIAVGILIAIILAKAL